MSSFPFAPTMAKHLTVLSIDGLTYNEGTGALTAAAAPVALRGVIQSFSDNLSTQTEDVHAAGSGKANNVAVLDDAAFDITIHLDNAGNDYNKLRLLRASYTYVRISYTMGVAGTTSDKVETLDMCFTSLSQPFQGDGAQMCNASFAQIDSGANFRTRGNP